MTKCQLPVEIMNHIFYYCDENTLNTLVKNIYFDKYKKYIEKVLENKTRKYWREMQINYIGKIMQPMMETHQKTMLFGDIFSYYSYPSDLKYIRKNFLDDWHESDIEIYSKILSKNTDFILSFLKKEKERINKKYNFHFQDLEIRPLVFNKFALILC